MAAINCVKSFDVSREGKGLRIRMQAGDIIVSRLSRAFQVESNSLYLKEEFGDMAYWPNDGGNFNVMHLANGTTGKGLQEDMSPPDCRNAKDFPTQALVRVLCRCSQPTTGHRRKNKAIAMVILAEANKTDKGATSFREVDKHMLISRKTPLTFMYIISKVRESFGDESLELFTSNGLKVFVTEGTRDYQWVIMGNMLNVFGVGANGKMGVMMTFFPRKFNKKFEAAEKD